MRFDLTDLRLFLNVHQAGTITGGAEATHMTLASASERIRTMEQSLGTSLLLRERSGVRPTPAGFTLLHHARLMLQQAERLRGDMAEHGGGLKGYVRLLCNTSAMSEYLPEALGAFLAAHPGIGIDLEERSSPEIADALRNGQCDVGMLSDAVECAGLETFFFCADPLSLVVPRDHPLAMRAVVGLADAVDYDFVGLADGSALHEHVAQHARKLGKRLNYRIRLRGLESICRLVGQGIGIAIVPRAVAVRCSRSSRIKQIALTDSWAARNLVLGVRQLDKLPAHAQQLVQHLLAQRGQRAA
jgi:DNA-binding transcriptional LysR family regulator